MSELLEPLIQRAVLEVTEYDYNIRTEMEQTKRSLPFYVMSYLKSGEALLRIEGKEYIIKAGDAILIRPNKLHDHIKTSKEDSIFLWWHFTFCTFWKVDVLRLFSFPTMVHIQNPESFEEKFMTTLHAFKKSKTISDIIYKNAKSLETLACLLENFLESEETTITSEVSPVFLEILYDVLNNYRADLSLGILAEKYHMNSTYISNKFKMYFGISPIYLNRQMVLEKAKEYLISTPKSISEISEELGFSELSIFTRFFSEKIGLSPKKFRNEY